MRIEETERISHPAREVFVTLRDRTPELAAIMPNIEAVRLLERRETPPRVHLWSRWQATNDDVPSILRPFVGKELLAWLDRAAWDESTLVCSWQLESAGERKIFTCVGTTTLAAEGDARTVFRIAGDLKVNPDQLPGVPGFLARKVQEPLERFIGNAIRPNLTKIASAVQRYLDSRRA